MWRRAREIKVLESSEAALRGEDRVWASPPPPRRGVTGVMWPHLPLNTGWGQGGEGVQKELEALLGRLGFP